MTAPPLLSVVTVVRNDRAGLAATAASLAAQDWRGFEWLVVDGDSDDGTVAWLAASDAAAWWRSAADRGPYDGMNAGLARASGGWVLFLNAGDTLAGPRVLARLADALRTAPDADLLYGDALERGPDGRLWRRPARRHGWAALGMFAHHQAMVYRRAAVADLRYDTRWIIAADYDFTLRVLAGASRVVKLPFAVCLFASGGLSQRRPAAGRREQAAIRREVLGLGHLSCAAIAAAQWLALQLRRQCATLYMKLRCLSAET